MTKTVRLRCNGTEASWKLEGAYPARLPPCPRQSNHSDPTFDDCWWSKSEHRSLSGLSHCISFIKIDVRKDYIYFGANDDAGFRQKWIVDD
jgi:hypothetical protein